MEIEEYRHLWQPGFGGSALVRLKEDIGTGVEDFVIYNINERNVLLIEDEGEYQELVRRMIESGAPILDDFPPRAT
ncbi:hypothetical protein ACFYZ5_43900 [Streptomyces chartreusis]|uniref:hypothetical protein n=1 Tax=Streptomyces chartreusis TaxID=1969 RepID=UPI0036D09C3B